MNSDNANKYDDLDFSEFGYFTSAEQLSEKLQNLFRDTHKSKPSFKSVISPLAPTESLCLQGFKSQTKDLVFRFCSPANKQVTDYEKAIVELLHLSGCRITEALSVTLDDILSSGRIRLKGLKGSSDRLIDPVIYKTYWLLMKRNNIKVPNYFSRFYFYRLFKKFGIYEHISKSSKTSVTHSFRYNYINNLLLEGLTLEEIQNAVGHKSIKSTIYYLEKLASNV